MRDENRGRVKRHTHDEHDELGHAHVALGEEAQVEYGVFDGELAIDEDGQPDDRDDAAGDDEAGAEPVVFLALVEHGLQGADGDDEQAESPVVDGELALADGGEVRRVFHDAVGEVERQDADRDIDEEDPAPTVVVDDPAADGGAEHRRHHHGHAIDGESHAALGGGKGVGEYGLLAGLQAAAGRSLEHAEEDQHAEGGRQAAKQRGGGEKENAGHVKALAADAVGDPAAQGEHDGVGDEVAGEHPGGFIAAGGERAADVGHGHVGDGGVERLHEGGEGDGDGDEPGIGARPPGVMK